MRFFFILAFCLFCFVVSAQEKETETLSLEEALQCINLNCTSQINAAECRKQLTDLKSEWYFLLFRIQKFKNLHEYFNAIEDLERIAEIQFVSGEINLSEKSGLVCMMAEAGTQAAMAENDMVISMNRIQQLLQRKSDFLPSDTTLTLYMIDKSRMLSSRLNDTASWLQEKQIEIMQLELDNLFMNLQLYSTYKIPYAELLIHASVVQFKSEEIDYIELVKKLTESYSIKNNYLDILNNYNQSAIQLEHEAY